MPTKQALHPVQAHAMLRNSPTYQVFVEHHGRWVTEAKAVVMVRSFQQLPLDQARQQVQDWLDTDELLKRKGDGMLNVASIFLAMGY